MTPFITISGWVIAVILFGWQVYERVRNRKILTVSCEITTATGEKGTTKYLLVTVKNEGRRPFHAVDVGVLFSNGDNLTFFNPYLWTPPGKAISADQPFHAEWITPSIWLYRTRPYQYGFSYSVLRAQRTDRNASVDKIYVVEETGDVSTFEIVHPIRRELNG